MTTMEMNADGPVRAPVARSWRRAAATAVVLAVLASLAVFPGSASAARNSSGVSLLGYLNRPAGAGDVLGSYAPYFMDPVNRRLYTVFTANGTTRIAEFDLDTGPVPQMLRTVDLGVYFGVYTRPPAVTVDSASRTAYILNVDDSKMGGIQVLDLKTLKLGKFQTLASLGAPGVMPSGITYSAHDHRLYVVGHVTGNSIGDSMDLLGNRPAAPVVVVALDAKTQKLDWIKPVPQCQELMNTFGNGTLVARSQNLPALYFACARPGDEPGHSGLVRMWIKPNADQSAANDFPVDFFPVSGKYASASGVSGWGGFDYASERFYILSQAAETPGAWVFDGKLSAWVGFIGASDNFDTGLGIDQGNGHVYVRSGLDGKLIVADGRATPVPQGEAIDYDAYSGSYLVDPVTHRAFVWTNIKEKNAPPHGEIGVLLDQTPQADSLRPPDYDALTSNVPEGPNTVTDYSGGTNGYGVREVLVGGAGGVLGAAGENDVADQASIRKGDRGLTAARLPSLDLRPVGASGTAQALVSDTNTDADLNDSGNIQWPWTPASCLDGDGEQVGATAEFAGSKAAVDCDLAKTRVEGSSLFAGLEANGLSVASSSLDSRIYRDAKLGLVTQSVASARGVELTAPDGTKLSIGEVKATAATAAHGHPGTAKALWERTLSDIEVTDPKGKPIQQVGQCTSNAEQDDCQAVIDQINSLLQMKMRLTLPRADVVKTPKGAFAGVQQTDADFFNGQTALGQGSTFSSEAASRAVPALQAVVYNDNAEKSRLVVQFAALQASSIYTDSPETDAPQGPPSTGHPRATEPVSSGGAGSSGGAIAAPAPGGGSGTGPLASGSGGSAYAAPTEALAQTIPAGVLAFLTRSPKEALLFAGVWLIFGGAGMSLVRRRQLLRVLDAGLA